MEEVTVYKIQEYMGGNVTEWEMEDYNGGQYYGNYRVSRGGYYILDGSEYPASYRSSSEFSTSLSTEAHGFRITLYLNV